MEDKIIGRDLRKKEKFQVDDEYMNGFARICGAGATAVYMALCRHANREQEAWPSLELLAERLKMNKRTVMRAIVLLEGHKIIHVTRGKDSRRRQKVNVYVLTDKSCWTKSRVTPVHSEPGDKNDTSRVTKTTESRVTPVHRKDTHTKDTHTKGDNLHVDKSKKTIELLDRTRAELEKKGIIKSKRLT